MLLVLLLLSITGDDVPAAAAAEAATQPPAARCENARTQSVRLPGEASPGLRSLAEEPLANAYRPVVRDVRCDRPEIVAKRVGQRQR
ncbi:hypothetical protein ABIC65_002143 [Sphingomonas trueperi]|jgi:hypothetical protein|uniref:hypothetical protein n=1 Tax=Sphingomonas trueperi TaxID=53317 RepID=UPI003398B45D